MQEEHKIHENTTRGDPEITKRSVLLEPLKHDCMYYENVSHKI